MNEQKEKLISQMKQAAKDLEKYKKQQKELIGNFNLQFEKLPEEQKEKFADIKNRIYEAMKKQNEKELRVLQNELLQIIKTNG